MNLYALSGVIVTAVLLLGTLFISSPAAEPNKSSAVVYAVFLP
ncbi:hypothetical protein [Leyella stercorea]|nr:hypothetical protein [Leyella stercorea]